MSSSGSHSEQEPLLPKNGDEESQPNRSEGYGTSKAPVQGVALAGQEAVTSAHKAPVDYAITSTKTISTAEPKDEDPVLLEARRTVQRMLPVLLIAVQFPPLSTYLLRHSLCHSVSFLLSTDQSW